MDALSAIAFIAERKIEEAIADGQFDNLSGTGKPLHLEDLSHLPPNMRMAYTILKNSGYIEKATEPGKAVSMRELLESAEEERDVYARMQRLKVMAARVQRVKEEIGTAVPGAGLSENEDSPYLEKLMSRV